MDVLNKGIQINHKIEFVEDEDREYRKRLAEREHKIGDGFVKTLLTLSGGALGLSFVFIKDIVGKSTIKSGNILIASWSILTLSLTSILIVLYLNMIAHRCAINQIDEDEEPKRDQKTAGGKCAEAIPWLNFVSVFTFIAGVIFLFIFAFNNLGGELWMKK